MAPVRTSLPATRARSKGASSQCPRSSSSCSLSKTCATGWPKRVEPDRGDVAEKIVIVAIFVALAIAVGAVITKAVTGDATNISHEITAN